MRSIKTQLSKRTKHLWSVTGAYDCSKRCNRLAIIQKGDKIRLRNRVNKWTVESTRFLRPDRCGQFLSLILEAGICPRTLSLSNHCPGSRSPEQWSETESDEKIKKKHKKLGKKKIRPIGDTMDRTTKANFLVTAGRVFFSLQTCCGWQKKSEKSVDYFVCWFDQAFLLVRRKRIERIDITPLWNT